MNLLGQSVDAISIAFAPKIACAIEKLKERKKTKYLLINSVCVSTCPYFFHTFHRLLAHIYSIEINAFAELKFRFVFRLNKQPYIFKKCPPKLINISLSKCHSIFII